MPLPLYIRGWNLQNPLDKEGGWASELVWALWRRGQSLLLLGIKPWFIGCLAHSLVTIPATLSWLSFSCSDIAGNIKDSTSKQDISCIAWKGLMMSSELQGLQSIEWIGDCGWWIGKENSHSLWSMKFIQVTLICYLTKTHCITITKTNWSNAV
jgi:hypothetical protein